MNTARILVGDVLIHIRREMKFLQKKMMEQNIKIDHDRLHHYASWFTILKCVFRDAANSRITNYTGARRKLFILNATSQSTGIGIMNFVGSGHEGEPF
jgi:hypothetical protein